MGRLAKRTWALLLAALLMLLILDGLLAAPLVSGTDSPAPLPDNQTGWWGERLLFLKDPEWLEDNILSIVLFILSILVTIIVTWYYYKRGKQDIERSSEESLKPSAPSDFPGLVAMDTRPPPKNPNFTGRTTILKNIYQILNSSSKVYVISGTGGMGKTQIAAQYLYQHENEYKYKWWLPVDPGVLSSYYASLAFDLASEPGFPKAFCRDLPSTVTRIKNWLEQDHGWKWLLILDNAIEPDTIRCYLPREGAGHAIVTTRNSSSVWDNMSHHYQLVKFELDEEAIEFLIKRTKLADREGAKALAKELGCLPLALEQAGAYIKETGGNFSTYLEQLKNDRVNVLSKSWPADYPEPVSRTWNISFEKSKEDMPLSANLLSFCSFLAPEPERIPKALLSRGLKHLDQPTPTSSQLEEAIQTLVRYSLVTVVPDSIYVHNLMQDVIRYQLPERDKKRWAEAAVSLVDDAFPEDHFDNPKSWPECALLLPHALAAAGYAEKLGVAPENTGRLLNECGLYLQTRGEFAEAKSALTRAIEIDEKVYGSDHPTVARDVNNLGAVLNDLGDLQEAKKCFERALKIGEKVYGPDHPTVARDVNNLGAVLQDLGDLEGAKKCYERAREIDEKVYGPDHPEVATDVNNLDLVLKDLDDLQEAKECFERALKICRARLGEDHPHTKLVLENLKSLQPTK
jgi:tetratricopeptide (TPR) repeat protein